MAWLPFQKQSKGKKEIEKRVKVNNESFKISHQNEALKDYYLSAIWTRLFFPNTCFEGKS